MDDDSRAIRGPHLSGEQDGGEGALTLPVTAAGELVAAVHDGREPRSLVRLETACRAPRAELPNTDGDRWACY